MKITKQRLREIIKEMIKDHPEATVSAPGLSYRDDAGAGDRQKVPTVSLTYGSHEIDWFIERVQFAQGALSDPNKARQWHDQLTSLPSDLDEVITALKTMKPAPRAL